MSGFGACRTLLDVSLIHFVVNSLSQLKYILGLADQRAHASTFECVRLCSEGKISRINDLFFRNTSSKSLNLEEKENCEGMLTKAECLQALKSMKPAKTPGSDGLPIEFYKVFWNEILDCLLNTINYAYTEGKFSIRQRRDN